MNTNRTNNTNAVTNNKNNTNAIDHDSNTTDYDISGESTGLEYAYHCRDPEIDRSIGFAEVDPVNDFERLHTWLSYDHVKPYWQLDLPRREFRFKLDSKLTDNHLTPYVGLLDHVPMSYWETYQAIDDLVGQYYDAAPTHRGVHLLIGPPEYLGCGYARPLLKAITAFQFETTDAIKVISEPDTRNDRAIHVFEQCGYEAQRTIDLPEKEALLMFCDRDRFQREIGIDQQAEDIDV